MLLCPVKVKELIWSDKLYIVLIRSAMSVWMGFIGNLENSVISISGKLRKMMFFGFFPPLLPHVHISAKFLLFFNKLHTHLIILTYSKCTLRFVVWFCSLQHIIVHERSPGDNTSWSHKKMNGVKELFRKNVTAVGCIVSSPCCFHWKLALYQHLPQYPDYSFP